MNDNFIFICGDYISFIKNGKILETRSSNYRVISSLDEKTLNELIETLERKNLKKEKAILIASKNENDLFNFNVKEKFKDFIDMNLQTDINKVEELFNLINNSNIFENTFNNIILKNNNKINKNLLNNKNEIENVFEIYIGDDNLFWTNLISESNEKIEKTKIKNISNELNDLIEIISKTLKGVM